MLTSAPEMDYIKYDPKMKDTTIYEKSIYMNYPNSTIKSKSERMFEFLLNLEKRRLLC